jgi:hypothetical protein
MFTKFFPPIVVLLFSSAPLVHADVVPVTANRQISVGGGYACAVPDICGTGSNGSFAVSDTSQSLGLYNKQLTGSSPATGGNVHQTSNALSNAIALSTDGSASGAGLSGDLGLGTSSLFSLEFMLTAPSQVHIFGNATLSVTVDQNFGIVLGSGTQSVVLTGPGVNFAPSIPVQMEDPINPQDLSQTVPWDSTLKLLPGQYMIQAVSDVSWKASGEGPNISTSFGMSLTADFTPLAAVPEPSPAVPFLFSLVAAIGWGVRRHVRRCYLPAPESLR